MAGFPQRSVGLPWLVASRNTAVLSIRLPASHAGNLTALVLFASAASRS